MKKIAHVGGVPDRLRELLAFREWGKLDLARESGVSYAQIRNLIRGRCAPYPQTVAKIARALGTTSEYIIEGSGERTIHREPGPVWTNAQPGQEKLIEAVATISAQTGLPKEKIIDVLCEEIKRKVRDESLSSKAS